MTDLRKAAEMMAYEVPLHELLEGVPENARLVIDSEDGMSTSFIPVGQYCKRAASALRQALAQEQEPVKHREECWACGCEECICATKVPGYYESKIKEAVLAERKACAKVAEEYAGGYLPVSIASAIRARGEK